LQISDRIHSVSSPKGFIHTAIPDKCFSYRRKTNHKQDHTEQQATESYYSSLADLKLVNTATCY